jgi:hypothetical protein
MSNRYKPVGNWTRRLDFDLFLWGPEQRYRDYATCDVSDVREITGTIWHSGAHKVTIKAPKPRPDGWPRSRTFIGEYAWRDSERYAEDAIKFIAKHFEGR